jgi:NADPH:quinone reductase-like Zn-dependent oxidoreductase
MVPTDMTALIQKESGYAASVESIALTSLDPYVSLAKVAVPRPKANQVLIEVALASVNPSDLSFIKGNYGQPRMAGHPAGFEGVGKVVSSGGGFMANRLVGRRVAFVARQAGSWARYAVASVQECIPLRKDIRDEDGAAMIVNPLTAHAMFDLVKRDGARSFVMTAGASQLCKLIAGLAREEGYAAISIVRRDEQIEPLKRLGASHVLNCEAQGYAARLRDVLAGEKPRVLLDAVTGSHAADIFHAMGQGARWVVYGRLDTGLTPVREPGQLIFQSKQVEGFWLVKWLRDSSLLRKLAATRAVQARFASGQWRTDVAAIVPLAEAHARLPGLLAKANEGKVMLKP